MIFNNFVKYGRGLFRVGSSFASVGKNLALQGRDRLKELLNQDQSEQIDEHEKEVKRKNMQKNFVIQEEKDRNHPLH